MQRKRLARAKVFGSEEFPHIMGEVGFTDSPLGVWVACELTNLPKTESGFFGFHLHEGDKCEPKTEPYFEEAKGHYNPKKTVHPKHAGDFPNILAASGGYAKLFFLTDRFKVSEIVGRSVIIHYLPDDYVSQPSGSAGKRIACGKIMPALKI